MTFFDNEDCIKNMIKGIICAWTFVIIVIVITVSIHMLSPFIENHIQIFRFLLPAVIVTVIGAIIGICVTNIMKFEKDLAKYKNSFN